MATIRQSENTFALTIATHLHHRHFQKTTNADLFIATLFRYRDQGKFVLHGFAIMPDHVHILLTPSIDQSTAKSIQLIKGGYSFAARRQSPGEVWQAGHHEHRIRDLHDYNQQLAYIANNPARKNYGADFPHVHTASVFSQRIDPTAAHLLPILTIKD